MSQLSYSDVYKFLNDISEKQLNGVFDLDSLQDAVYCSVELNRIIFRLNKVKYSDIDDPYIQHLIKDCNLNMEDYYGIRNT